MAQTFILTARSRQELSRLLPQVPDGYVVKIDAPRRSLDQNAMLWACISDVSRAMPEGRRHSPEVWKCLFMAACGHQVQFEQGLDGTPFPVGFRSSRLSKAQMADLITTVLEYGDRHGVKWSVPA